MNKNVICQNPQTKHKKKRKKVSNLKVTRQITDLLLCCIVFMRIQKRCKNIHSCFQILNQISQQNNKLIKDPLLLY